MQIHKVAKLLEEFNDKTTKSRKLKSKVQDLLLASHIIGKNEGRLQATTVCHVAKALKQDRIENNKEYVDYSIYKDSKIEGDIPEALTIVNMFKRAEQFTLDKSGKIVLPKLKEIEKPAIKLPETDSQDSMEIRKGFSQNLPTAIKSLSSVKYTIDTQIRDQAEADGVEEYMQHVALATSYDIEDKEFNFHYFGDSRVRVYPSTTNGISPQGSDLGKALIKNKTLKAKEDLHDLFVKMAEEYMDGNQKFDITRDNLLAIPYQEAEYPYLMLQLQNDYKEYLWTGYTSANYYLDARCSGSQILSGLGKYSDVTAHIGMEVEEHDLDLYEIHAVKLTEKIKEELPKALIRNEHITENGCFIRKLVKRPVMTQVYNSTLISVMDEFKALGVVKTDVTPLAKAMKEVLSETSSGTTEIMLWLKCAAQIISTKGHKTIQWTLPDGVIASQTYNKTKELRVSKKIPYTEAEIRMARMKGRGKPKAGWYHDIQARLRVPALGLNGELVANPAKAVNGISANTVHSLDACVARKIIDILSKKGIEVTRFIHDSLSVHMNYAEELYSAIIEAHIWLFNSNFLENLKTEWEMLYGVTLPELPEQGDWNPETLRECKRFWE